MNKKLRDAIDKIAVGSGLYVTKKRYTEMLQILDGNETRMRDFETSILNCGEELSALSKENRNLYQLAADYEKKATDKSDQIVLLNKHIENTYTNSCRETSRLRSIIVLSSSFFALLGFVAGKLFLN